MPSLPDPNNAAEDLYGTCIDIYNRTSDNYNAIVDEYPDPRDLDWRKSQGWTATDDFVLSDPEIPITHYDDEARMDLFLHWMAPILLIIAFLFLVRRRNTFYKYRNGYNEIK